MYDPRFSGGQMNPGRPPAAGGAPPAQAVPRPQSPQPPSVAQRPVGRPPGPSAPPAPGPGAPPRIGGSGVAQAAQQAAAKAKQAAPGAWAQAMQGATGWRGAIAGAAPAPAMMAASLPEASKAAAAQHFAATNPARQQMAEMAMQQQAPSAAPQPAAAPPAASPAAAAPAPAGPAPAAPAPPAAPGATSGGWSEAMSQTSITGGVGDPEVDAALKSAVLAGLKEDPFGADKVAAEKGRIWDEGMAGLKGQREDQNADLVRRGISSSGVAAELGAETENAARSSIANQQRQTMTEFAKLSSEHKQAAIGQAQTLASELASRGISLEQLKLQREQMAASRGGGGGGNDNMIEIDNGDGTTSQVDLRLVDLMLSMGEGGMW